MAPFSRPSLALLLLILLPCTLVYSLNHSIEKTASLFEPQASIYRVGPSTWPKPTHLFQNDNVVPIVEPIIGQHRPENNAVFAYAEGYPVENYVLFISTLRATGFDGDIVLAIADEPAEFVVEYLSSQKNVVVYKANLACLDEDRLTPAPRTEKNGGIFQMCRLEGVYGTVSSSDNHTTILQDPRAGRVVATLRYEWYWIWATQYQAESWILLLDARDSLFQTNPFSPDLPRSSTNGILYFFGESHEATRLGKSKKNANWLRNAYGTTVLEALKDKPTICSGSTMGNQRAIETYLRAMVNEWDETDIAMTGAGKFVTHRCQFINIVILMRRFLF